MENIISKELDSIEEKYGVKIILASESGSRAWGFPSNDSDYDVRFIYVNNPDWYLTIAEKKDIIELPIDNILDINGWGLRKSLQLMRKSNSPLLEWLSSPIKYRVWHPAFERLLTLSKRAFMPETSCYHYLSLAKKSSEKSSQSEMVKLKKYMYAIRSILCCEWIVNKLTQPPMQITDLLAGIKVDTLLKDTVFDLIEQKKVNPESFKIERSETIEWYVNQKIDTLSEQMPKNPQKPSLDEFDDVFKYILNESGI